MEYCTDVNTCEQCGLGRTGTLWAHSSLPVECHPDIVTMAKPLANVSRLVYSLASYEGLTELAAPRAFQLELY